MKQLMCANWKMHKSAAEAKATAADLAKLVADGLSPEREVIIFPPFTALGAVAEALAGKAGFSLGAQNFYPEEQGAFTGEISPAMLLDAGCAWALAGHSERRHVFHEPDDLVGRKMTFGLAKGLRMMLCIGETIEERRAGQVEGVLSRHLATGLAEVPVERLGEIAVAYEPVWAIGTGETAGPKDIAQAHDFVRGWLRERWGAEGGAVPILYGGSVKPDNAGQIMGVDNVDGVLVGGASLGAESFSRIVLA